MNPIINPNTLTEEQRNLLRAKYDHNALASATFGKGRIDKCKEIREWYQGKCDTLISIFGKTMFVKGENNG